MPCRAPPAHSLRLKIEAAIWGRQRDISARAKQCYWGSVILNWLLVKHLISSIVVVHKMSKDLLFQLLFRKKIYSITFNMRWCSLIWIKTQFSWRRRSPNRECRDENDLTFSASDFCMPEMKLLFGTGWLCVLEVMFRLLLIYLLIYICKWQSNSKPNCCLDVVYQQLDFHLKTLHTNTSWTEIWMIYSISNSVLDVYTQHC